MICLLKLSQNTIGMLVAKYRAVLKTMSLKNSAALLLCASLFCASPALTAVALAGETIDYPADGVLARVNGQDGSLAPSGSAGENPGSKSASLDGNSITVNSGGTVSGAVFGAVNSSDTDHVTNNRVFINSGATVNGGVFGGATFVFNAGSAATGNSVTITDGIVGAGPIGGTVYGGYGGTVANNSVSISGGEVRAHEFAPGYFSNGNVHGGEGLFGATGNTVTISGNAVVGQNVYGGSSSFGAATGNTVTMTDGVVHRNVFGGSSGADASNNSVTISGGTVGHSNFPIGGGNVWGGNSHSGAATGNTVTVSGGSISGTIYGGYTYEGSGAATDNTVTISGGSISGSIYGGYTYSGSGDIFSGNTLNLKTSGLTVQGLYNFENLNFYLPSALGANDTVLTVTGTADLTDGAGRSATVNVGIDGGSSPLKTGDRIVLIDAGTLIGAPGNSTANGQGMQGVLLLYDFDLQTVNNQLLATVAGAGPAVNPRAQILAEGRAAGMAFVSQGADAVSGDGLKNAWREAKETGGKASFSALSGGSSRYKTGSHVDVDGISLLTGVASRRATADGEMMTGIFLEGGWGSYDSYNSFTNAASVRGSGDTSYYGLGFLARSEKASGAYSEGSLRFGRTKTDFASGDLRDSLGRSAAYDSSASYWGAHLGLGKIKTSGKNTLDLYGKYLFTRQSGDDVNVLGDPVSFSGSTSHRLKTGFRISREASEAVTTYAGAAYEYEFDGESKATAYGFDVGAPGVKGSTGILELGAQWKKGAGDTLDLGLLGYVGKRQGVSGTLQFKHAF